MLFGSEALEFQEPASGGRRLPVGTLSDGDCAPTGNRSSTLSVVQCALRTPIGQSAPSCSATEKE